jgi:hypothetical protein
MNSQTLADLHADLTELRQALDREDFSEAGQILGRHDQRLRQYIEDVGVDAPVQALRDLLQLQHTLQAEMLTRREAAASALRGLRQSGQASRLYQEAGS